MGQILHGIGKTNLDGFHPCHIDVFDTFQQQVRCRPGLAGQTQPGEKNNPPSHAYDVPKSPAAIAGPVFPATRFLDGSKTAVGVLMAGTRTIAQLTYRIINGRRILGLLVLVRLVVGRMTTRTTGTIGRRWPGHDFTIATMTIDTAHVGTVIPRIIGGEVPISHRQPGLCRVAVGTLLGRNEMIIILANGRRTVMTAVTNRIGVAMVEARRHPSVSAMTDVTFPHGLDVVSGFTLGA